jgi:predicted Zn finger-like uncharacterized protein
MYTQCPECLTIYEIDEDALQASLGIVRCGRCDKRFDALRTLSDTLPIEPLGPLPEQDPGERAPTLTEAVPPSTIERAAKKPRSKKNAAGAPAGASADDWFADIESELTAASTAPDVPAPDTATDTWRAELPETTGSESAATTTEEAGDTPADEAGELPDWINETPQAPAPAPEAPGVDPLAPFDSAPGDAGAKSDQLAGGLVEAESAASADVGEMPLTGVPVETAPADAGAETANTPAPVYIRPRRRFSLTNVAWALGCALLALLLAAQLAWADRSELFRNPATQAWMARACRNVPCNLPLIRDTAKLELLSRDVRPDPNAPGALTVTATIRNSAAFRQPWPVVVVELTDLDNAPVAMRRFRPVEYMTDPARRADGITPGATAVVAFEVADPGKRAVAFQFGFE